MRKSALILLMLVIVISSLGFASADTCLNSDDTIMRLYSETNAHGALWNKTTSYPFSICYKGIFGEYIGTLSGEAMHNCDSNNAVLWLNQSANSHASVSSNSDYTIPICYGDLRCSVKTSGECDSLGVDYKCVVTLSGSVNAHLTNCSSSSAYDTKICCKKAGVAGELYWANMEDESSSVGNAQIEDTVKLIWKDIELKSSGGFYGIGDEVQFRIVEHYLVNEQVRIIDTEVKDSGLSDGKGRAVAKWTITKDDYKVGGNPDNKDFHFEVVSHEEKKSEDLTVEKNSYDNSPPSAEIKVPSEGQKFLVGEEIVFEQHVSDEDDDLKVWWQYGDGEQDEILNCLTTGNCNTTHTYDAGHYGTRIVRLIAEEMGSGRSPKQQASDSVQIFIYKEGTNVFAVISSPPRGEVNRVPALLIVNGEDSFVADCADGGDRTLIECEDDAPTYAKLNATTGKYCYEIKDEENSKTFNCYDLNNTIGISTGKYNLHYEWTFQPSGDVKKGVWSDEASYSQYVKFNKLFIDPVEHVIELLVGYEKIIPV